MGVVKHMKTTMQTHIVLKNAINPKKNQKNIKKKMKKGRETMVKESFNFFLVNHCDAVYIV